MVKDTLFYVWTLHDQKQIGVYQNEESAFQAIGAILSFHGLGFLDNLILTTGPNRKRGYLPLYPQDVFQATARQYYRDDIYQRFQQRRG